jgi:hypothetical protein
MALLSVLFLFCVISTIYLKHPFLTIPERGKTGKTSTSLTIVNTRRQKKQPYHMAVNISYGDHSQTGIQKIRHSMVLQLKFEKAVKIDRINYFSFRTI